MFEKGILISVPAADIAKTKMTGSVFGADHLLEFDVPADLKSAVKTVKDLCDDNKANALVVARPEMFTNGDTLNWLRSKIGSIKDHVCISEGRTIRVIPEMDNHVFFLRLGIAQNFEHLVTLQKRCPELIAGLRSQINSAFTFRSARNLQPVLLQSSSADFYGAPGFLPFCLVRHSLEATLELFASAGKLDLSQTFVRCSRLIYVPLTEVALASEGFCRLVAKRIADTFFDPSITMILVLPRLGIGRDDIGARIAALMTAIRGIPGGIPSVPSHRIIVASDPCPASMLFFQRCKVELILHHTVDVWAHPQEYYSRFDSVVVAASRNAESREVFTEYMEHVLGRSPAYYWLEHVTVEPNDSGLAAAW